MTLHDGWRPRCPDRVADDEWRATVARVRGEFEEMPCMRVTAQQAAALLGLQPPVSTWVLDRLEGEGFLSRTDQGEYMRRTGRP
jgi:predicted transcriptional regulator of viral defense system